MIQGLRTVIYHVADLAKAKAWYSQVLEHQPYFDQPFYVGYAVGGFELGLVPDGKPGPGGTVAYWGVPDAAAALKRLEQLGANLRAVARCRRRHPRRSRRRPIWQYVRSDREPTFFTRKRALTRAA